MEFILKGRRGGMIVPAGFSLTFSLTNDSLDYFSVCEIEVTDEPYFQLDTDSLTWKSITISNGGDRIIPRSIIGSDLRCPHLLSDNIYNPELREYYMGYGLGTGRDECSTGFYELNIELDNMTDIYSVVIWAFRLLNNSQCISTNKSMTVMMRKDISDTGVLCMYSNKTLQHDSLTIMYTNCEPIITARFITLRMSKDVFRHDLSNVVEIAVLGKLTLHLDDKIGILNNISMDNKRKESAVVTLNDINSTVKIHNDLSINSENSEITDFRIIIFSLIGIMLLITLVSVMWIILKREQLNKVSIDEGIKLQDKDFEIELDETENNENNNKIGLYSEIIKPLECLGNYL